MRKFDLIIQGISDEDKIGHLIVVDIKFDTKNVSKKQNLFTNFEKKTFFQQTKDKFFNFLTP